MHVYLHEDGIERRNNSYQRLLATFRYEISFAMDRIHITVVYKFHHGLNYRHPSNPDFSFKFGDGGNWCPWKIDTFPYLADKILLELLV